MLQWFDENPDRYWWTICAAIALALFALLRPLLRPGWRDVRAADWRWSLVILGVLMIGRWPTWFVRELNPDESQLIAGALTLRHDPVFWRSVNGGTAGPLDFYALLPAGWISGADGFLSARVTALCVIAIALIFAHQTIALVYGRQVARVTGFAALCFEALTLDFDLLHYSTEIASMGLLAVAFFLAVRRFVADADWRWNLLGGILLGAVPFAKLQAAPMAALLGFGWIAGELWRNRQARSDWTRSVAALCAGACGPLLMFAVILVFTGEWHHAVISYILGNIRYAAASNAPAKDIFLALLSGEISLFCWLAGTAVWLLLTLPLPRSPDPRARRITGIVVLFAFAALGCILAPRFPYVHYWQLFVVPWTLVIGAATGLIALGLEGRGTALRCGFLCACLFCTTGGLLAVRASELSPFIGAMVYSQTHPQGVVACELTKYARPGEALGLWGWMNRYYLESGLRQATRDVQSIEEIVISPNRDYSRQLYLSDLRKAAPPVFVDAVGPGNFYFNDRRLAHDAVFPELAAYIQENYTRVAEIGGSRIYVRNDRRPSAVAPKQ